jgi:hypothetical protein
MPQPYVFTARQVVDLTGLPYPSLADMVKRGIVVPSKRQGIGKGNNSLFDICDVAGIAAVQFLRPKGETANLLRSAFAFWHTDEGRRLVASAGTKIDGVVVLDGTGKVTFERELSVARLVEQRDAAILHLIEPNRFLQGLFGGVALHRMAGDHVQPLPSGREPRGRSLKPRQETAGERGASETRTAPTKKAKRRRKGLPVPALLREAGRRTPVTRK